MAELEKVIKGVHDARRYLEDREWVDKSVGVHIDALNDTLELLKEQEAVVQCKDCKHGEKSQTFKYYPNLTWCNKIECTHDDDWFCADGEYCELK